VFHQYTLVTKGIDRDKLLEYLQSKDIPCAVYYPVPMHLQKAYLDPRYKDGDFPVTEQLSREVISLPMHTELDDEQVSYIASAVLEFVNSER
jgi:dTDP-4-amino-4,6-dideoxygalactose transaminase